MHAGGPLAITFSWVIVGIFAAIIGAVDGGDLFDLPDRGWPLLLVRQAGARPSAGVVVVHRLDQPDRPGRLITASIDYALATFIGFFIPLYDSDFGLTPRRRSS